MHFSNLQIKHKGKTGQLQAHSPSSVHFTLSVLMPTLHSPLHQHVRAARPRLVHLLQPEYIMHLIGVLQLREREGAGGGTELLKITSVHFAYCQY